MTSEQFTYWLQGFVELNGKEPSPEQWQSIKDHLKTVFHKITPVVDVVNERYCGNVDFDWVKLGKFAPHVNTVDLNAIQHSC